MHERSRHIRNFIVPDISVKLLDLCLSSDENGILMPPIHRRTKMIDYRADVTLKEMIEQKLKDKELMLPLTLRKRKLYEISVCKKKNCSENKLEEMFSSGVVPITMRKHLLCKQCRAG